MKRTISSIVIISMLAFVAMSCGKKKSSGGNSNPWGWQSPLTGGQWGQNPSNDQALQTLQQWMANGTEPYSIGHIGDVSYNGSTGAFDFDFVIGKLKADFCYITSDSITYSVGVPGTTKGTCTGMQSMTKATNPRLAKAIGGEGGALTLIQAYFESGSRIVLIYVPTNNGSVYMNQQVVHKIDTSLHSIVNPIYSYDGRTRRSETLINIYPRL